MNRASSAVSLAGCPHGHPRHVCAFFNDDDEEYRVLLPFIREGFACGDKALHFVNLGQFGGETVVDIIRTHPFLIIGGILQQNPFFVPPSEFLGEGRAGRAARTDSTG